MLWFENKNITIFFTQKSDGDMLFEAGNDLRSEKVRSNREKLFSKNNIDPLRLVNIAEVHGKEIHLVREKDLGRGALDLSTRIAETDGLITNIKNSYLMVTGADCFPVLFYDPEKRVTGVSHCGWRSILAEIFLNTMHKFQSDFGSKPADIQVWIGPGIKTCHFEVKDDVASLFEKNHRSEIINRDGKTFIDLVAVIKKQLVDNGISPQKITEHSDCTFCNENLFSYRRRIAQNNLQKSAMAFIIHLK